MEIFIFMVQYGFPIGLVLILSFLCLELRESVNKSKHAEGLRIKHILAYIILLPLVLPAVLIRSSSSVFLKVSNKIFLLVDKFLNIPIGKGR